MAKIHLLRDYTRLRAAKLGTFALNVGAKMTGNANFPGASGAAAALTAAADNFSAAIATALDGTKTDTANKRALRLALIALLDGLANFVELNGQNDPVIMLSSGYPLARTSNVPKGVGSTAIRSVTNEASTKLRLTFKIDPHAWLYEVEISSVPGVWVKGGIFTNPRDAVLTGLTPGMTYAIRARLMGQGNQTGEWSETVNHMST